MHSPRPEMTWKSIVLRPRCIHQRDYPVAIQQHSPSVLHSSSILASSDDTPLYRSPTGVRMEAASLALRPQHDSDRVEIVQSTHLWWVPRRML